MAVAFGNNGAVATSDGTVSVFVDPHASADEDDLQLLHVLYKFENDTDITDYNIPDIEGWNLLWATGGGVANTGEDTGMVANIIYWRTHAEPITSEVPVPDHTCSSILAIQSYYTYSADNIYMIPSSATDDAHGANYSATTSLWVPDDGKYVIVAAGLTSTAGSISGDVIDGTVSNFSSETVRVDQSSSAGDNVRLRVVDATVATDPSSGHSTTYSHTNASSNSGSTIFIEISEVSGIDYLWHHDVEQETTGSSGASVRYRAQTSGNQLSIVVVNAGNDTEMPAVPTVSEGWSVLGSVSDDLTPDSDLDIEFIRTTAFYRFGRPDELFLNQSRGTFGQITITQTNATVGSYSVQQFATNEIWDFPVVASDAVFEAGSGSTTLSSGSNMGLVAGDMLLIYMNVGSEFGDFTDLSVSGMTHTGLPSAAGGLTWDQYWFSDLEEIGISDMYTTGHLFHSFSGTEAGPAEIGLDFILSNSHAIALFIKISAAPAGAMTLVATPPVSGFSTYDTRYSVVANNIDTTAYTKYNILRISATEAYEPEFLLSDEPIEDSTVSVSDYEFHFASKYTLDQESHYYQMDLFMGNSKLGSLISNVVTPHTDRAADSEYLGAASPSTWIKRIGTAANLSQPISIEDFRSWKREANILGEYDVLGNPYPIIITDVMKAKTGSFTFHVYHDPDWLGGGSTLTNITALEEIFDTGETYYFQTTWPALSGIADFYFMVRSYTVERVSNPVPLHNAVESRLPLFRITMEFQEMERPAEQGNIAPLTWETLLTNYATWAQMSAANTSWLDVLQDG